MTVGSSLGNHDIRGMGNPVTLAQTLRKVVKAEPRPDVFEHRVAAAQLGLRLLLAEEQATRPRTWETMSPVLMGRIRRKIQDQGVESLSPKEKLVLQQLVERNKLADERAEQADVEQVKSLRSKKEDLEKQLKHLVEKGSGVAPETGILDTPEEQEARLRSDLKSVTSQLAEEEAKGVVERKTGPEGEQSPAMKKALEEAEKVRDALERAGVKDVEKFSVEKLWSLQREAVERDPLSSQQPVKKTIGSLKKFVTRLKSKRLGIPAALRDLSQADDEGLQNAAKQLEPVVEQLLTPLGEATSHLGRLESLLESLDQKWSPETLSAAQDQLAATEKIFRGFGSQINESLGALRNKHSQAANNLKTVLATRYKAALQQFRARGATPEQAAEMAQSHQTIRKLKAQADTMKSVAEGVDFILKEFGQRYINSLKAFKQLKTDFEQMARQPKAAHALKLAKILASLSSKETASTRRISKKLRRATKRVAVLRYLSTRHESPVTRGK